MVGTSNLAAQVGTTDPHLVDSSSYVSLASCYLTMNSKGSPLAISRTLTSCPEVRGKGRARHPVILILAPLQGQSYALFFIYQYGKLLNFCYKNVTILLNFRRPIANIKYFYTRSNTL